MDSCPLNVSIVHITCWHLSNTSNFSILSKQTTFGTSNVSIYNILHVFMYVYIYVCIHMCIIHVYIHTCILRVSYAYMYVCHVYKNVSTVCVYTYIHVMYVYYICIYILYILHVVRAETIFFSLKIQHSFCKSD